MVKANWGIKRLCPSCGTRYYDLNKQPPKCPKCKTAFDPEALLRSRRGRPAADEAKAPAVLNEEELPLIEDIETDVEEAGDEEDDTLIEDTSELGEEDVEVLDVEDEDEN